MRLQLPRDIKVILLVEPTKLIQCIVFCGSYILMYNGIVCYLPALPSLIRARRILSLRDCFIYCLLQDALAKTIKNPRRRKEKHNFKDAKMVGVFRKIIFQ